MVEINSPDGFFRIPTKTLERGNLSEIIEELNKNKEEDSATESRRSNKKRPTQAV